MSDSSKIRSIDQQDSTPSGRYARWIDEINMAEKEMDDFRRRGRSVVKRFKDERSAVDVGDRKFNVFTTNTLILQAALYSNLPKATVSRRFGQANDDPARVASLIIQNAVMQDIDEPECDFDQVMRDAVEDYLVPGMGTAWLRLETDTEEKELESQWVQVTDGEEPPEPTTYEVITRQEVIIDHVFWEDFLYSPCRTWKERRWVGRRAYMDYDALVKRFGQEKADQIPLDYNPRSSTGSGHGNQPKNVVLQQAVIYEIWDRKSRTVYWLSKGFRELLDEQDDPLKLEDFEPCPKPLFALITTSNCVPTADFVVIQDQYNELDDVNNRISMLVTACKVVGAYDSSATSLQNMLSGDNENQMVPVDNWAVFGEKGGLKGVIDWLPLDAVIAALERLRQAREDIKNQINELTGISDIIRGNTKASETLGAQEIKAQYANIRIEKRQREVARFAQDILRIKAEMICRHFEPEQIIKAANLEFYPDVANQPLVQAAMQLIKGDHQKFEWRVNIQADSLAQVDRAQQKQEKVEFMNAVATLLQSSATTLKAVPESAPILFESLKFAISGFKGSQELEGVIDQTLQQIMVKIQNPPPPPPDPAIEKAKMDMQLAQQKHAMDMQKSASDMRNEQQKFQLEIQKMIADLMEKKQAAEINMAGKVMDLEYKEASSDQQLKQNDEKFAAQLAQNEAKARASMVKDARKDSKE